MLPATKVNCFIFACSHPSSVKKLDVQNRNTFTYIGWHRFESRITNIRLSLPVLHWKEHNEFHLSFCNGHSEFIVFKLVGILREVGALVENKSMVKSREFIKIIFFVSCHAIKLKVNRLNRLKAKNHQEHLYLQAKSFFRVNCFSLNRQSLKFRTKIDGV